MADKKKKKKSSPRVEPASWSNEESFDSSASYNDEDGDEQKGGLLSEGLKKLFTAGVSAAFLTEESLRNYIQDLKLPKEILNVLLQSAAKSKDQMMNRVGNEIITIIQKIDFVKEASRFVENHKFRISAEIEVVKKESK